MEIRVFRLRLALKNPFRIAHGNYSYRENIFVHLRSDEGLIGMGEAPVVPYYGYTADDIENDLRKGLSLCGASAHAAFSYPVSFCAVRSAILDLNRQRGVSQVACPPSSFTVAFDDDIEAMVNIAAGCGFRRLKVKAGIPGDIERVRAIRERLPEAIIRIDANQGWSFLEAEGKIAELEALGVELIEEPIVGSPVELEHLASNTGIPILLDESARDIAALDLYASEAPSVSGIVVKIAKNGGPRESLELAQAAKDRGMEVMLSSMVETSLGIGAALPIASLCRWCDLDAPLLIANDPFTGLIYEGEIPLLSGQGIRPGSDLVSQIDKIPPLFVEI